MQKKTLADRIIRIRQDNPSSISTPASNSTSSSDVRNLNSASTKGTSTVSSLEDVINYRMKKRKKETKQNSQINYDTETVPSTTSYKENFTPTTEATIESDSQSLITIRKRKQTMRTFSTQYSPRSRIVYGDSNSAENRRRPSSLTKPLADVIKELGSKKSVCDISNSSRSRENTINKEELRRNDNVSIEDNYPGCNQVQRETNEGNSSKQNTAPGSSNSKDDETVKHITKVTITPKKTRNLLSIVEGSQHDELVNEDTEITSSTSQEDEILNVNIEIPVNNDEKPIVLPVIDEDMEHTSTMHNSSEENNNPDEANDIPHFNKNEITMSDNKVENGSSKREEDVRKSDIIEEDKSIGEKLRVETEREFDENQEEKQQLCSDNIGEVKSKQGNISKTETGGKDKQVQGKPKSELSGLKKGSEKTGYDHKSQKIPTKEENLKDTSKHSRSNLKMKKPEKNSSHKRTEISKTDNHDRRTSVVSKRGSVSKMSLKQGPANGLQEAKDQEKDKKKKNEDFELLMQTYIKNVQEEQLFSEQVIGAISKWKESTELEESRKSYSEAMKPTKETSADLDFVQSKNSMSTGTRSNRKHKKHESNVELPDGVINQCQDDNSKNNIPEKNDRKESENFAQSSATKHNKIDSFERQISVTQESNNDDKGLTNNSKTRRENSADVGDVKDDRHFCNPTQNLLKENLSEANAEEKSQMTVKVARESENNHIEEQSTAKQDTKDRQIGCNTNEDDTNNNDDIGGDNNDTNLIHTDGDLNIQQPVFNDDTEESDSMHNGKDSCTVKKETLNSSKISTEFVLESETENTRKNSNENMDEHIVKDNTDISKTDINSLTTNEMNKHNSEGTNQQSSNHLNETKTVNSKCISMSDENDFDTTSENNSTANQTGQQENVRITDKRNYISLGEGEDIIASNGIYPLERCTPGPTFETKVTANKAFKNMNDQQISSNVKPWDKDEQDLPPLSKLQRQFTRLHHVPCENHVHDKKESADYKFGDGTLFFEENKKLLHTSRVDKIIMDLYFAQNADYSVHKDRLTYQYFNTNVGFARSSTKLDASKEFIFGRQNTTIDCKFAETLKRIDLNKTRENSFFLPSPRNQCRKVKAYANLQKKLSYVLKQ
ncbi:bromodomain-containing protein DDB_G0280777-like [Mytilus trossulus]|uniref:bromodomain-containing protein DDB_G0280777-like n=1 Tax=Mytilus trossulus TaxID=6551 RepID=UPI003007790C